MKKRSPDELFEDIMEGLIEILTKPDVLGHIQNKPVMMMGVKREVADVVAKEKLEEADKEVRENLRNSGVNQEEEDLLMMHSITVAMVPLGPFFQDMGNDMINQGLKNMGADMIRDQIKRLQTIDINAVQFTAFISEAHVISYYPTDEEKALLASGKLTNEDIERISKEKGEKESAVVVCLENKIKRRCIHIPVSRDSGICEQVGEPKIFTNADVFAGKFTGFLYNSESPTMN